MPASINMTNDTSATGVNGINLLLHLTLSSPSSKFKYFSVIATKFKYLHFKKKEIKSAAKRWVDFSDSNGYYYYFLTKKKDFAVQSINKSDVWSPSY